MIESIGQDFVTLQDVTQEITEKVRHLVRKFVPPGTTKPIKSLLTQTKQADPSEGDTTPSKEDVPPPRHPQASAEGDAASVRDTSKSKPKNKSRHHHQHKGNLTPSVISRIGKTLVRRKNWDFSYRALKEASSPKTKQTPSPQREADCSIYDFD